MSLGGRAMVVVDAMVEGFIITFGITPPTAENKKVATWFIASGLIGTVVGVAALVLFVVSRF